MTMHQTFHFTCDACGSTSEERFEIQRWGIPVMMDAPKKWRHIEGKHYCPAHEIEIKVDGERP